MLLVTCLENNTQKENTQVQTVTTWVDFEHCQCDLQYFGYMMSWYYSCTNAQQCYKLQAPVLNYSCSMQLLVILLLSNIKMSFPSLFNSPVSFWMVRMTNDGDNKWQGQRTTRTTNGKDNKWWEWQMTGMTNDRDDKWWGQQMVGTTNSRDNEWWGQPGTTDNWQWGRARGTTTNGNDKQGVDCRMPSRKTSSRQWGGGMPLS